MCIVYMAKCFEIFEIKSMQKENMNLISYTTHAYKQIESADQCKVSTDS